MFAFFHLNLQVLAVTYWPLFQWRTGTSRNWGLHRGRSFLVATIGPQKLGTEPIDTKIWEKHACIYNFVYIILYNIYIYIYIITLTMLNNTKHGCSLQNLNKFDVSSIFGHTGDPIKVHNWRVHSEVDQWLRCFLRYFWTYQVFH